MAIFILMIVASFMLLVHIACFVTSFFVDKNRTRTVSKNYVIIKRLISVIMFVLSLVLMIVFYIFFGYAFNVYEFEVVETYTTLFMSSSLISIVSNLFGSIIALV